jgi:glutamine amidotransferase
MITIVDYGLGNIQAFANIYKRLNIAVRIARTAEELRDAERIILPGVGAFDWAMTRLDASGMRSALDERVLIARRPVLGVCVGMQIMAKKSEEGRLPGLGWFDAEVKRFDESRFCGKTHLPHMGWNDVQPIAPDLFKGLVSPLFYFLHSYYFVPSAREQTAATTDYNGAFTSAVSCGNIFGVQFHPEKSHGCGVQLLKNFADF